MLLLILRHDDSDISLYSVATPDHRLTRWVCSPDANRLPTFSTVLGRTSCGGEFNARLTVIGDSPALQKLHLSSVGARGDLLPFHA